MNEKITKVLRLQFFCYIILLISPMSESAATSPTITSTTQTQTTAGTFDFTIIGLVLFRCCGSNRLESWWAS